VSGAAPCHLETADIAGKRRTGGDRFIDALYPPGRHRLQDCSRNMLEHRDLTRSLAVPPRQHQSGPQSARRETS
jgi:hypothetical protein